MVDQLAIDYANQPVVFLEFHTSSSIAPLNNRFTRFRAAHPAAEGDKLPYVMVDSGHRYQLHYSSAGAIYREYKSMVDAELLRAPQAEIQAVQTRVGNRLQFQVTVTNRSGVKLSSSNKATVHVLVWEDKKVGVTSRYVRAAPWVIFPSALENNAQATFNLETPELSGVDWTKLHALALVDYRPGGTTGPYDMLQASMVTSSFIKALPENLVVLMEASSPTDTYAAINLTGLPAGQTWKITEDIAWLEVVSGSGNLTASGTASTQIKILASQLPGGTEHNGTLTITATVTSTGASNMVQVPVRVLLLDVKKNFLPLIHN